MSEQSENKQRSRSKNDDWVSTAISLGGEFLKLACKGMVLGVSGALGQKLVSGSRAQKVLAEGNAVIPLRKIG